MQSEFPAPDSAILHHAGSRFLSDLFSEVRLSFFLFHTIIYTHPQLVIFTSVPLTRGNIADATVSVFFVVPADEAFHPGAGILQCRERAPRSYRHVFQCPAAIQHGRYVAYPLDDCVRVLSSVLPFHPEYLRFHWRAVVRTGYQRLLPASLAEHRALQTRCRVVAAFNSIHFITHDLAAEHLFCQIQVTPVACCQRIQPCDSP